MQRRGGARPRHREARDGGVRAVPADAREEFLAEGRLGLLEAHREFDRKHRSGANFKTFAFSRVHGRVQEAFAGLGGFPRAVYRAAKKDAAMAREQAHGAGQVHTKDYLAQRVGEGADQLHLDPFTAIGERLEKNAVRAAIELASRRAATPSAAPDVRRWFGAE